MTTCSRCHKHPPEPGRKRCASCNLYAQKWFAHKSQTAKTSKRCAKSNCNKPTSGTGRFCKTHATQHALYQHNYHLKRVNLALQAGTCADCRTNTIAIRSSYYCDTCLKRKDRNNKKYRKRQEEKNRRAGKGGRGLSD